MQVKFAICTSAVHLSGVHVLKLHASKGPGLELQLPSAVWLVVVQMGCPEGKAFQSSTFAGCLGQRCRFNEFHARKIFNHTLEPRCGNVLYLKNTPTEILCSPFLL